MTASSKHGIVTLVLVGALALGAYAAILRWFDLERFYYLHFDEHGAAVVRYNGLRLLFGVCLAWLVYAGGHLLLSVRRGAAPPSWSGLDRVLVCSFAGASAWHLVLLATGLLGFYTRPAMVVLTSLVLVASVPHARDCLLGASRRLPGMLKMSRSQKLKALGVCALLVTACSAFVLVKGIYPAGGHDYYTHYFYYYLSVVRTGSLAPNDVWYHFYYSKGAGLYFLAMLLTDPLAPQIVTTVLMAIGAATVFALLRQIAPATLIPWLGAAFYFALLIYTPGPVASYRQGGWADLEKLHEPAAVFVLGIVWMTGRALSAEVAERRRWLAALALCVAALVSITTVLAFLVGAFFVLLIGWFALRRDWRSAAVPLLGATSAGISLSAILAINYSLTGLALDQLLLRSWAVVDLHKLEAWGVLNEALLLHWGMTGLATDSVPLTVASTRLLIEYLRLDLCAPIALGALVALTLKALGRFDGTAGSAPAPLRRSTFGVLLALAAMLCLLFVAGIGREQPISFYRLTTFMYAPTLCLCLGAWVYCPRQLRPGFAVGSVAGGIILAWFFSLASNIDYSRFTHLLRSNVSSIFANALRFADGRYSIKDAYRNQQGWPGRQPWGGIYPAMESVLGIVGRDVPVYSMHVHSYCMIPGCTVYGYMSMRLARDSYTVMYGTPDAAKRVLQQEGINFFFVSMELEMRSPLPRAPLFSPDHIGRHLAVRWTDGTSYLLTWADAATTSLDDGVVERYRERSGASPTVRNFPYEELGSAYGHFREHGLRPYRLPWCRSCEGMKE